MYSKVARYALTVGLTNLTLRIYGADSINAIASAFFWVLLWGLSFELFFKKYGTDIVVPPKEDDPFIFDSSDSGGDD
jgi:hypothetical protein